MLPLIDYLAAVGLHRTIAAQLDPSCRSHWTSTHLEMTTSPDLWAAWLRDSYCPTPILSPWNGRGGVIRSKGAVGSSEYADAILAHPSPRLEGYRQAIQIARSVAPDDKPEGDGKRKLILKLRSKMPDEWLPWCDACWLDRDKEIHANPLLGSGGNAGSCDYGANAMLAALMLIPGSDYYVGESRANEYLHGATTDELSIPGLLGGVDAKVNPFVLLMALEGACAFGGGAWQRYGAERQWFPGIMPGHVGRLSEVRDEDARAAFVAPTWHRPTAWPEIQAYLADAKTPEHYTEQIEIVATHPMVYVFADRGDRTVRPYAMHN